MAILNEEKISKNGVEIENLLHESKNVLKTSYNYQTEQLVVTFHRGGVYNYNKVSNDVYELLKESPSIGSFINSTIKPNHTVRLLGEASPKILQELKNKILELQQPF